MDIVVLALRLVIIGVLLVSGGAKLLDREGTREAMIGFGVPVRLLPFATFALPLVEIALAVGLIFAATVRPAAVLSTALFAVFTVLVARVVLAGDDLECHCFGQLSSGPVSWLTVSRNVALTLAAGVVWWWAQFRESTDLWEHLTWPIVAAGLAAVVIAAMGWFIVRLLDIQAELLGQIEELQQMVAAGGVQKPPAQESFARMTQGLVVVDTAGNAVPVPSLKTANAPALLFFVSNGCRACNALMPDIAAWQREFEGLMQVVCIGSDDRQDVFARAEAAGIERPLFREDDDLRVRLKVRGHPSAVLVDHDGFIRAKPMLGGVEIRRAIEELRRQAGPGNA